MNTTPASLHCLAAVAGIILATASTAPASVVLVTVTGYSTLSISNGQPYPTDILGNGNFTANFSYDDNAAYNPVTSLYDNALLSFNMTFAGGSGIFTATGGDIESNSGSFAIRSMNGENFPMLAGMSYSNFIVFKFRLSVPGTSGRLPTAAELTSGSLPYYTWIAYDLDVNKFILTQRSFTAVPEPTVPMLGLAALGLAFRRKRRK